MSALPKSFPPSVYSLFLRRLDTVEIAKRLKMKEHEVEHALTVERSRAKGKPAEFAPSPYRHARAKAWRDAGKALAAGRLA